jgi:hypothetical protein
MGIFPPKKQKLLLLELATALDSRSSAFVEMNVATTGNVGISIHLQKVSSFVILLGMVLLSGMVLVHT